MFTRKSKKFGLSAPWSTHYNKVRVMFEDDEDIEVGAFDNKHRRFEIDVYDYAKYIALKNILFQTVRFGNVVLHIDICYKGETCTKTPKLASIVDYYEALLEDNPHLSRIECVEKPMGFATYVVFKKEVIQFYNDDTSDLYGNWNGLCEDIARKIFKHNGICICTEIDD